MSQIYVPPPQPSVYLQAALDYVAARNQWALTKDTDTIIAVFAENLEHRIIPKSLGRPVLVNRKQFHDYTSLLTTFLVNYKMSVHDVIEAGNVIVLHASSTGQGASGAPYSNEYMVTLTMEISDGTTIPKISKVLEFVDSASVSRFYQNERDFRRRQELRGARNEE